VKRKIRVVQYGVGPIGASIVKLMQRKASLEIVGALDNDPAKVGRDLGEVIGESPLGVFVSADPEAVFEKPVDIVVHTTSSYLRDVMDQLLVCLAAGCCVVSTCEELAYPYRKHPELSKKLDAAAQEEGVALLGTGVNPGFVMDKLVLTLSAVSQRVDRAKAVRVVDASKRRLPLQRKIGAGMTVEEFQEQVAAGTIKHHGLPESVAMISDGLGIALDDISETIEPVIAPLGFNWKIGVGLVTSLAARETHAVALLGRDQKSTPKVRSICPLLRPLEPGSYSPPTNYIVYSRLRGK
jgi:4-hydroxy-tetrahydrodipicolinate reductase